MDVTGYLMAFGLATAAGLNAWVPLLATGLLARYTDLIDVSGGFAVLTHTPVLIALTVVGDKVPAVDHALHAAGTVIAPATGVVAGLASTTGLDVSPVLVTVIGLVAAETTHGTRMAIRPFSTVGTAGIGNPVLSLLEDVGALGLSVLAIALPVLAALVILVAAVVAWRLLRRLRRRRYSSAPSS
jgi:hypothetical protein